jgi:F-type H+-transporting ATPase subunit delta
MAEAPASPDSRPHGLDIAAERIARVYAQAVIEAADKRGCRAAVVEEFQALAEEILPKVPQVLVMFASPRVPLEQKDAMIDRIAAGRMQPTTAHALHVLARHGRLGIVAEVAAALRRLADELEGRRQATVTTAVPVPESEQPQLVAEVEAATGEKLATTFIVNPDLIGGLIVTIGDTIYDQSIATGLSRLGGNLQRRTIHEIQHGRDRLASA